MAETHVIQWRLRTRADQATAWRLLRETDTFNRVAGMNFRFTERVLTDGSIERIGRVSRFGLKLPWIEKPFEFDEPRGWQNERVFLGGPVDRYVVSMALEPDGEGTLIVYRVEFWPRNALMMPIVKVDANRLVAPKLDATLKRAVRFLDGEIGEFDLSPPPLKKSALGRLSAGLLTVTPKPVADRLAAFIANAPLVEQNMMHPLKLARRWKLPPDDVVEGCFSAVQAGVLSMHWQLMCPSCQMPQADEATASLAAAGPHCKSCDIRYDGSFPDSVAVTFRPDPRIRAVRLPIECLGSPGRTPSIVAQVDLKAQDSLTWEVALLPGSYQIRTWPEQEPASLQVRRDVDQRLLTLIVGPKAVQPPMLRLSPGRCRIQLRNKLRSPIRLAIQRRAVDDKLLTLGRLLEMPHVSKWLPKTALAPSVQVDIVARCTLAVVVHRGGTSARGKVAEAMVQAGCDAVHAGNNMVIATFAKVDKALLAAHALEGARHVGSALGYGPVVLVREGMAVVPSGRSVEEALALARWSDNGALLAPPAGEQPEVDEALQLAKGTEVEARSDGRRIVRFIERTRDALMHIVPQDLEPGDVVDGRFEIAEQVGMGGFGAVFAARDRDTGDELVVKVLKPRFAEDAVQVTRFFNEGHVTAQLDSPHIARTIDYGLGLDGRLYIAMERLRGRELADELKDSGVLAPDRAIKVCVGALKGLAAAHEAGLIHRDIKPSNMFICDEGATVKLIDFGIALIADRNERVDDEGRTAIGTPHYMSPEQAQASAEIDPRSDLYSLAVVLYEALSGTYPFTGSNTVAVLLARIRDDPYPLILATNQDLPGGLDDVVMRALSREVARRHGSAAEMAEALMGVLGAPHRPMKKPALAATTAIRAGRVSASQMESVTTDASISKPRLHESIKRAKTQILGARTDVGARTESDLSEDS